MDLTPYLEDLESRIDPEQEEELWALWVAYARGENTKSPFTPPNRRAVPAGIEWPHVNINDAVADEELMLLSQLERVHHALETSSNHLLVMRPNYGVGNIATMFGAELFIMPYETDTLPNVRSLPGGEEAVERLVSQPLPSHLAGNGEHIFSMARRFLDLRETCPKLGRYVIIDQPDTQGPLDTAELLWGSDILLGLYTNPELAHALIRKVTGQMKRVLDAWAATGIHRPGYTSYFGQLGLGGVFLRNDSATNISPAMYEAFVFPYDQEVLDHFGGGGIHFCGRGDHWIDRMSKTRGLTQVDISQPHLNDMGRMLEYTLNRGINLFCARYRGSLEGYAGHRFYQAVEVSHNVYLDEEEKGGKA